MENVGRKDSEKDDGNHDQPDERVPTGEQQTVIELSYYYCQQQNHLSCSHGD